MKNRFMTRIGFGFSPGSEPQLPSRGNRKLAVWHVSEAKPRIRYTANLYACKSFTQTLSQVRHELGRADSAGWSVSGRLESESLESPELRAEGHPQRYQA